MQKVIGIGGFFFRAKQPAELAKWYRDVLGIDLVPEDYDTPPWEAAAGPVVFAPFEEKTEYFGPADNKWMLNFRVDDLDAMVKQIEASGTKVEPEGAFPNGKFAKLFDPEGNPLQLWQEES